MIRFFLLVAAVLGVIFLGFKPLAIKAQGSGEFAQIELTAFTVHELTTDGVKTIFTGADARRYEDRYEVYAMQLTDRSGEFQQQMEANFGVYKEPLVTLHGNVRYRRDDGLYFNCNEAIYDRNRSVAHTEGAFVMGQGTDAVHGDDLVFNSQTSEARAVKIEAYYALEESK